MTKRFFQILTTLLLLAAAGPFVSLPFGMASQAVAQELRFANLSASFAPRHLPDSGYTSAPKGFVRFCAEHPEACQAPQKAVRAVRLGALQRQQLTQINLQYNAAIAPITDMEQYGQTEHWSYADTGLGDCEDYVLEKRRALIEMGWPASVLLITVVRDHNGDGHAVLTVVTDKGDLILDNQENAILPWKETGYRYVKRQSYEDPNKWVFLGETMVPTVVGGR
ncbi:MAG: transglutaminase-like cysteine peptidase [Xanthobacter sp.]